MTSGRIYLLLIGLFLVLAVNTFAQKSPLMITGTITEVKSDKERLRKPGKVEDSEPYFKMSLRLQYHNRGETALIIPTPNSFHGGKKLLFYDIPSADSKISATADEWMAPGSYDWTSFMVKTLESVEPSSYYFKIIEPGGYFETMETFKTISGFKREKRLSGDKVPRELEFVIPEHPYFKIRYSLSIKNRPESSEPLADAQRRWKQFGKLLLNSDGDFFFETDIIINKLPN